MSEGGNYLSVDELGKYSLKELTTIHNGLSLHPVENEFTHKDRATLRVVQLKVTQDQADQVLSGKVPETKNDQPDSMTKDEEEMAASAARKRSKTKSKTRKRKAPAKRKTSKKSSGRRGRAPKYGDNAKIKVLAKENPFRDGSKAAKNFKVYKTGLTVGDYVAKGGDRSSLKFDVGRKFISVS